MCLREKGVNDLSCDETLYRQYVNGDDAGLDALMKKYGDPLTLYIDGYLHDVHEAEELMLDVFAYLFTKKPNIRDGGLKAYLYKAARPGLKWRRACLAAALRWDISSSGCWRLCSAYAWQRTWLKIAGTCGLLGAAITFHAIYNLLIARGGAAQYGAHALPAALMAADRLPALRPRQKGG